MDVFARIKNSILSLTNNANKSDRYLSAQLT